MRTQIMVKKFGVIFLLCTRL